MTMQRISCLGFVTAVALAFSAAGATAATTHHHHHPVSALGGTCTGSASAIAQYCEDVPGAGGGHHPGSGTPTLSSTLPAGVVRRLGRTPSLSPLLRIPAATSGHSGAGGPGAITGTLNGANGVSEPSSGANASSLWAPVVVVLALIALLLAGFELVRRRRLTGRPG